MKEEEQSRHKRSAVYPSKLLPFLEAHVLCLTLNHEQTINKVYYLSHTLVTDIGIDKLVAGVKPAGSSYNVVFLQVLDYSDTLLRNLFHLSSYPYCLRLIIRRQR